MRSNSSPSPHHDKFEELAALAAVGELNAFELKYLREHLANCPECRENSGAFADIQCNDLGAIVAEREPFPEDSTPDTDDTQARKSLENFRKRFDR